MSKIKGLSGGNNPRRAVLIERFQVLRSRWDRKLVPSVLLVLFCGCPTFAVAVPAADATHLVTSEARRQGVPVPFALKMAKIESGLRCHNHSRRSSASGPLQVLRGTARSLGYRGDIRRASCAMQTHYGMRHLAMCWRAAKGRPALARRCHQQGISAVYGRR